MYRDLVRHEFVDETSQFDPKGRWVGGAEYYEREFTCYVPYRLLRRRPDLVDDFIAKHCEEDWLWGCCFPAASADKEMVSLL